jgi:UTP--glucose-1-phosphate uridylyltransferase
MLRLAAEQPFYGCRYTGRTYDCGTKLGFLAANVALALKRDDLAGPFREELGKLLG